MRQRIQHMIRVMEKLGDDGALVVPISSVLAYLENFEREIDE
jgi:hypothetical protein